MESTRADSPGQTGVGLYLAFLQLFFTLSWTVYVIFLPQLAAQAEASDKTFNVVHLIYKEKAWDSHHKDYEFSALSMRDHWASGLADIRRTLAALFASEAFADESIRGARLKKPIDELAGGRVYTGKQALELGLVDKKCPDSSRSDPINRVSSNGQEL